MNTDTKELIEYLRPSVGWIEDEISRFRSLERQYRRAAEEYDTAGDGRNAALMRVRALRAGAIKDALEDNGAF